MGAYDVGPEFYTLGVAFVAVLAVRAPLFGVYIGGPDFWELNSQIPNAAIVSGTSNMGFKKASLIIQALILAQT